MRLSLSELKDNVIYQFRDFSPEKIILFGSCSRQEHDEESDIDLIVVYQTDKRFLDRLKELYSAWSIPKGVDILAYTPEEFERMKRESSFVRDALQEGAIIYERK